MRVIFGRAGIYIAAGYMGSVSVVTTVKWFWFLIGLVALFGVLVHFAQTFKAYADAKGGAISSLYGKLAWLSILAWICYPVVWLFSEGFASFSVSFEVCAYAILDMITKVVVSFMVMSGALFLAPGSSLACVVRLLSAPHRVSELKSVVAYCYFVMSSPRPAGRCGRTPVRLRLRRCLGRDYERAGEAPLLRSRPPIARNRGFMRSQGSVGVGSVEDWVLFLVGSEISS